MPTFPGFHPDFEFGHYPTEVRTALRKIGEYFYVTRSFRPIEIGNSHYYAALIRPTDEFSIYVNTHRELLIIFATYETFEIRTLEAYDEFYSLVDSTRIDKSVRFLLSNDGRIEKIIRHYLDQHPEYPIVIPMTFKQIAPQKQNSLLEAVRRNYLLRDLFGYQNPLREETFFFGRQQIVNSVLDMAKSGQNSSLFGLRKSGKTSSIYAIQRKAKGLSFNVVVIDCQSPAVHARTYDSLLAHIVSEVRRVIGLKKLSTTLGSDLPEVAENFTASMNACLSASKNNILIIFDEIENISPKTAASVHWREGIQTVYFWQILRSYIQASSKGRVSLCIVGTNPQILEAAHINDIANPVYLYANKQFIPSLSFDETREMVERLGYFMGLEFPTSITSELHRKFGGHPFFTRQVCSKIHQITTTVRPTTVSAKALERAMVDFAGQLEAYLRDIVQQLGDAYPDEFNLLKAVVQGDNRELTEFGSETPELIDHLIGYGLVARVGDEFEIRFDAIKTALLHLLKGSHVEDCRAEISKRRNALETNVRVALFHWSRTISSNHWSEIIDQSLTAKRREALSSLEPGNLFSSKNSPLYLSDLLVIIKHSDVMRHLGHRKTILLLSMNCVNKLRRDAHALVVSDAEMTEVRRSFDVLETEFSPP